MIDGDTERESGYIHGATFAHLSVAINSTSTAMAGYVDPGALTEALRILHEAREALADGGAKVCRECHGHGGAEGRGGPGACERCGRIGTPA